MASWTLYPSFCMILAWLIPQRWGGGSGLLTGLPLLVMTYNRWFGRQSFVKTVLRGGEAFLEAISLTPDTSEIKLRQTTITKSQLFFYCWLIVAMSSCSRKLFLDFQVETKVKLIYLQIHMIVFLLFWFRKSSTFKNIFIKVKDLFKS